MRYTVEGRGEFPCDMLRYDSSRAVDDESRAFVEAAIGDAILTGTRPDGRTGLRTYRVELETESRHAPATARWESFGFRVTEVGPGLLGEPSAPARGRPRLHAAGTTASERARLSDSSLAEEGGTRRSLRLSREAVSALASIRERTGETSDNAVIERLVVEEAAR